MSDLHSLNHAFPPDELQAEKNSLLEIPQVNFSSKALFVAAAGLSFVAALL